MDIKNKNELKRRIDLFLHDFTHEEYRINEEYCKETMRIMVDFIGHVDNRLDAADKRLKKAKAGEKALAEYIISNAHSCPIPVGNGMQTRISADRMRAMLDKASGCFE